MLRFAEFPPALIDLCERNNKPFSLSDKRICQLAVKATIGSSNLSYFQPWKGKRRSKRLDSMLSAIGRRDQYHKEKRHKDVSSKQSEMMFLSDMKRTYKGLGLRANKTTYMNPNIPFLTATPDALIIKNATEIHGVVEVKDLGLENMEAVWNEILAGSSSIGITGFRESVESPI